MRCSRSETARTVRQMISLSINKTTVYDLNSFRRRLRILGSINFSLKHGYIVKISLIWLKLEMMQIMTTSMTSKVWITNTNLTIKMRWSCDSHLAKLTVFLALYFKSFYPTISKNRRLHVCWRSQVRSVTSQLLEIRCISIARRQRRSSSRSQLWPFSLRFSPPVSLA